MSQTKHDILWEAAPHTIAKIRILEAYLVAWFQILGVSRHRISQDLTYVDGFAGPGKYKNFSKGSPVAALAAAKMALSRSGKSWKAGAINCCFIEESQARTDSLRTQIEPFLSDERIRTSIYTDTFTEGLKRFKKDNPNIFARQWPLFAFIDPCGATGVPLSDVMSLLRNQTTEVLLNFDADGIARIFKAGEKANHELILNDIYGDETWKDRFKEANSFGSLCRESLELYKAKLASIGRVKYLFPFEMRTKANSINYFLLFASQHPLGLEKMKEAMRSVDQSGEYCFSDARIGQDNLFRFDDPSWYSQNMLHHFAGRTVTYPDLLDFALLETPFINPKAMMKELKEGEEIHIRSTEARRKGTFNEAKIISIRFKAR